MNIINGEKINNDEMADMEDSTFSSRCIQIPLLNT
jgi:hypothetical protein